MNGSFNSLNSSSSSFRTFVTISPNASPDPSPSTSPIHWAVTNNTSTSSTSSGASGASSKTDTLDEIIPNFLYLSSLIGAQSLELLRQSGITHILTVGGGMKAKYKQEFSYQIVSVDDTPEALIYLNFASCVSFIDHAKSQQDGKVLVHCEGGVSRSATICAAYLMYTRGLKAREAIQYLQSKRMVVSPNLGFRNQLFLFEQQGFNLSLQESEVVDGLAALSEQLPCPTTPTHRKGKSSTALTSELFETPPENYNYEIATSSKVDVFIPTILEGQQHNELRDKKDKILLQTFSADDASVNSRDYLARRATHRLNISSKFTSASEKDFVKRVGGEATTNEGIDSFRKLHNISEQEDISHEDVSNSLLDLSTSHSDGGYEENSIEDEELGAISPIHQKEKELGTLGRPMSPSADVIRAHTPPVSIVDLDNNNNSKSTGAKASRGGNIRRFRTSSSTMFEDNGVEDTVSPSQISFDSQHQNLLEEQDIAQEDKTAATNVVGKVLMGYQMTASDKETFVHWLAQRPKVLQAGGEFAGLRQALRMMRRFVCDPSSESIKKDDEQRAESLAGLQHSLEHVSKILEKFTGFPLHSPGFMYLLQNSEKLSVVLKKLENEFKNALNDARGVTSSFVTTTTTTTGPKPKEVEGGGEEDQEEQLGIEVIPPPEKIMLSTPPKPKKKSTETNLKRLSKSPPDNKRKQPPPGYIHRRRRSATIDLLLLLAKLGLRRDQTCTVSYDAYRQFSQLLEGGAREKAAIEELDQASSIELLGYLESFPKAIKEDSRIQRLGHVCAARLVLFVKIDTAADICDQLLAQPKVTGFVREVATYAMHFSAALIGTQLTILRKVKAKMASTKLTAAVRGKLTRKKLANRQTAAQRIQQWRRQMREERQAADGDDDDEDDDDDDEEEDDEDDDDVTPKVTYLTTENIQSRQSPVNRRSSSLRSWQSLGRGYGFDDLNHDLVREQYRERRAAQLLQNRVVSTLEYASASVDTITQAIQKARASREKSSGFRKSEGDGRKEKRNSVSEIDLPTQQQINDAASTAQMKRYARFHRHAGSACHVPPERRAINTDINLPPVLNLQTFPAGAKSKVDTSMTSSDAASVGSGTSASIYSAYYLSGDISPRADAASQRLMNPIHALQGLLRHLCRVVVSAARNDMEQAYSLQQSLKQLQQHAKNLKSVHPRICVADAEERPGISSLPKARLELEKFLKEHPKKWGHNQTPYVYDFELRVLAFFPPCELDTSLQPPNDTSAKFRKILSTVFELMPCDDKALEDLTETATISQHASAGYALTTTLHYIDKATKTTSYMQYHHLGDESEGTDGSVAAGYVRYDPVAERYIFTEESGHYGFRWTLPGTRQSFEVFMRESGLKENYYLKPFYRQQDKSAAASGSVKFLFAAGADVGVGGEEECGAGAATGPSMAVEATAESEQNADEDSDWDFDD